MSVVSLRGVTKYYGEFKALDNVSLDIQDGELLTLLGPSGCGKSTMLRLIAGLLEPTTGGIFFGDTLVNPIPPHRRNVGLVFQNYSLFPHMTVFQNVAFGLRMRGIDAKTIREQVQAALEMVQLPAASDRYPWQLSGGQQQRVGLARALVIKPAVLLLDEPFGALDKKLRESMQLELKQLQKSLNVTSIFVTHDQEEALAISHRIAVVNAGHVEQVDFPRELYEAPKTRFVLGFVGASNTFEGTVVDVTDRELIVRTREGLTVRSTRALPGLRTGDSVSVACRPEKTWLCPEGTEGASNHCTGTLMSTIYQGSVNHFYVAGPAGQQLISYELNASQQSARPPYVAGDHVQFCWDAANTLLFPR